MPTERRHRRRRSRRPRDAARGRRRVLHAHGRAHRYRGARRRHAGAALRFPRSRPRLRGDGRRVRRLPPARDGGPGHLRAPARDVRERLPPHHDAHAPHPPLRRPRGPHDPHAGGPALSRLLRRARCQTAGGEPEPAPRGAAHGRGRGAGEPAGRHRVQRALGAPALREPDGPHVVGLQPPRKPRGVAGGCRARPRRRSRSSPRATRSGNGARPTRSTAISSRGSPVVA